MIGGERSGWVRWEEEDEKGGGGESLEYSNIKWARMRGRSIEECVCVCVSISECAYSHT